MMRPLTLVWAKRISPPWSKSASEQRASRFRKNARTKSPHIRSLAASLATRLIQDKSRRNDAANGHLPLARGGLRALRFHQTVDVNHPQANGVQGLYFHGKTASYFR